MAEQQKSKSYIPAGSNQPVDWALFYASLGLAVFARPRGGWAKGGWKAATRDPDVIREMFRRDPTALIAARTGIGIIVLDIDRKHGLDGYDTLEGLGKSNLPETPMAHTPHGGVHVYFAVNPAVNIRFCTNWPYGPGDGKRKSALDVLGEGTSVALPTPGYGYRWDEALTLWEVPLRPAPAWLAIRPKSPIGASGSNTLAPEKLLAEACSRIRGLRPGGRHNLIVREAFIIGCLVARGRLREADALHELKLATATVPWDASYTARQAARDLDECFRRGLSNGGRASR